MILSIDCGKQCVGWAVFHPFIAEGFGGKLAACGLLRPPSKRRPPTTRELGWDTITQVVIELPQIYPQLKGDPNDLVAIAARGAWFAGRMAPHVYDYESVHPREWKGTVDGDVFLKRITKRLYDREKALLAGCDVIPSLEHNVIDAIGLGLWKVGRL